MKILRRGSSGPEVTAWQEFLRDQNFYHLKVDDDFGPGSEQGTKDFQKVSPMALRETGIVDEKTYGKAAVLGFAIADQDDDVDKSGPNWPPKPEGLTPCSAALREELFGKFAFEPAPTAGNPEGIRITDGWAAANVATVKVQQLVGVRYAGANGFTQFNKKAAPQLQALFTAWERAGLLGRVLTWGGSYAPRFIRGSRTYLSNHAWGTAFDINVPWNGLRMRPALVGQKGSVRELVELAIENGFYWGGFFTRLDGMHFEVSKLL